ncbi:hypothetical protein B4X80_17620 [Listeria monocytogenes]|nr:hypothetical protein [Listeria monocytogenes]EAC5453094.1 hypothetical protein [Listeria monocytogenes]EAC5460117.1 hypothetical protein [Listeria monocytogenes]EAC5558578.1 hypothetical protein [Listeria monocytogenes]EAC9468619.1 hypothetical protein [Listeria monocytogenes]
MFTQQPQQKNQVTAAFQLCQTLPGRTFCTSRKHELPSKRNFKSDEDGIAFGTLHSIAHRIVDGCDWDAYADSMWKTMKKAVKIEFQITNPSEALVNKYYRAYRYMANGNYTENPHIDLVTDVHYLNVFKAYKDLKQDKIDYEGTFKQGIYFLKQHSGNTHIFDPYDNLVLVNFDSLQLPANANALKFYLLVCAAFCKNRSRNCYAVTAALDIYRFDSVTHEFIKLTRNASASPEVLAFLV